MAIFKQSEDMELRDLLAYSGDRLQHAAGGARSRLLLAMLGLLFLASSASGECAWMLWIVQGTRVEHLYASYTSGPDCIREVDLREQRLRPDRTLLVTRTAATTLNVTDQITAGFSTTYQCLPDTVDPRALTHDRPPGTVRPDQR